MILIDKIFSILVKLSPLLLILALIALSLMVGSQFGRQDNSPLYEKIITIQGDYVNGWRDRAEGLRNRIGQIEADEGVRAGLPGKKGRKP